MTFLTALTTLGSEHAKATTNTMKGTEHFLGYLATYTDDKMRYYASDMVLKIHLGASYASEKGARIRAAGHFFLGWMTLNNALIRLNFEIYNIFNIMKFVASSAAEVELCALLMNAKEGRIIQLTLK